MIAVADIKTKVDLPDDIKSSAVNKSVNVAGEMASCPSCKPLTSAISFDTLLPGKCPPVPVFAPCPPLK